MSDIRNVYSWPDTYLIVLDGGGCHVGDTLPSDNDTSYRILKLSSVIICVPVCWNIVLHSGQLLYDHFDRCRVSAKYSSANEMKIIIHVLLHIIYAGIFNVLYFKVVNCCVIYDLDPSPNHAMLFPVNITIWLNIFIMLNLNCTIDLSARVTLSWL